jgi:uncharacterized Zn-binding protein involved in type VI secretion
MAAVARKDDKTSGGGKITGSSPTTYADGIAVGRVTDTVTADSGHTGKISSGASTTYVDNLAVARTGDPFSGTYSGTIVDSCSPTTFAV